MAAVTLLTPNLIRSSLVNPGTQSNWTDTTIYGGAGPNRNTVGVSLAAYKVDQNQVASPVTVASYLPASATTFVTNQVPGSATVNGIVTATVVDGWYQYKFLIAPNYNSTTGTNNQYDVVFDSVGAVNFYQYINTVPTTAQSQPLTDPLYWIVLAIPTSIIDNVGTSKQTNNIVYQVINKVVDYQASIYYLQAQSAFAQTYSYPSAGKAQVIDSELGDYTMRIRNLFSSLTLDEALGKYVDGELNAQLAARYGITYNNITTNG